MPVLATFDGISIEMYYDNHPPPHVHAKHAGQETSLSIAEIAVLRGTLAPSTSTKVLVWAAEKQEALALEWLRARDHLSLRRL